ncbi:MAG: N-acetyl-gamma-glutamyl-phosphate reductase [Oscillospiraceae bacterium]|nr:N-acetyl-gamma-glutamyl-phosphate reductase [Oscillospiraceae bacterium]
MKPKIFIDGSEGTTGLQIYDRLGDRSDIELLRIDESKRKDAGERKKLINAADLVFLCLPDDAARESVSLIDNDRTRVIDASTAHRTHPDWVYGLPELSPERRNLIRTSRRVANPGCHATGFILSVAPLLASGIIQPDHPLTCVSLTGYSGAGKATIAEYDERKTQQMCSPGMYALGLDHKHLPEMTAVTGLARAPIFCPIICDYYKGMETTVTIHNDLLGKPVSTDGIRQLLADSYAGQRHVSVAPELPGNVLYSNTMAGSDDLEIFVTGNDRQTLIIARYDNLGKGAAGAAVQNMELMLER